MALPTAGPALARRGHAIQTAYNGYKFRSRTEARWAVALDSLAIPYEYEPEGYEFADGTRYLPDFYLPNENIFVEIKGPEPTEEEIHKLGMLALTTNRDVLLLIGQPGQHTVWRFTSEPRTHDEAVNDWLRSAPIPQDVRIHVAAGLENYGQYRIPSDLSGELRPEWRIDGRSGNRLFLDFDLQERKLALWTVELRSFDFSVFNDHFDLVADGARVFLKMDRVTLNTPPGETPEPPFWNFLKRPDAAGSVPVTPPYKDAINKARSARFEFGQSG